jgi:Tfp pilus assembly protein PilX
MKHTIQKYGAQKGYILIWVLLMLTALSMMVAALAKQQALHSLAKTHMFDHILTESLAWQNLEMAEQYVLSRSSAWQRSHFSCECTISPGLCTPPELLGSENYSPCALPAWLRYHYRNDKGDHTASSPVLFLEHPQHSRKTGLNMGYTKARYVVEYLGINEQDAVLYRITVRVSGEYPRTVSLAQSYYSVEAKSGQRLSARILF